MLPLTHLLGTQTIKGNLAKDSQKRVAEAVLHKDPKYQASPSLTLGDFLALWTHRIDIQFRQWVAALWVTRRVTIPEGNREGSKSRWAGDLPSCLTEPVGTFLEKLPPYSLAIFCSFTHSFTAWILLEHLQCARHEARITKIDQTWSKSLKISLSCRGDRQGISCPQWSTRSPPGRAAPGALEA